MDIPPEFELIDDPQKVYSLKKSLYGLKQSPIAYFNRFTKVIKQEEYGQCQSDHTLFVKNCILGKKSYLDCLCTWHYFNRRSH